MEDRILKVCQHDANQSEGGLNVKNMYKIAEDNMLLKHGIKYDRETLRSILCAKFFPKALQKAVVPIVANHLNRSYVLPFIIESGEAWVLMPVNSERDGVWTVSVLGGRCKPGENTKVCGAREMCEETARILRVRSSQLILLVTIMVGPQAYHYYGLYLSDKKTFQYTLNSDIQDIGSRVNDCMENSFLYFFKLTNLTELQLVPPKEKQISHKSYIDKIPRGKNKDSLKEFEETKRRNIRKWDVVEILLKHYPIKNLHDKLILLATKPSDLSADIVDCCNKEASLADSLSSLKVDP